MQGKLLFIEKDYNHDPYDEPAIKVTEITSMSQLITKFATEISSNADAMKILFENNDFLKALNVKGFRDVDKIIDAVEKIKANTQFYVKNSYTFIDINASAKKANQGVAKYLAEKDSLLLQSIDKSSLKDIAPELHAEMLKIKKQKDAQEKRRVAAKKAAADKNKQKKIDQARKLLEESGEL